MHGNKRVFSLFVSLFEYTIKKDMVRTADPNLKRLLLLKESRPLHCTTQGKSPLTIVSIWYLKPKLYTMSPKARGLAQHGGLPGWLEESEPAGIILYLMDGLYTAYLFRIVPVALTGAAHLWADGISSYCSIVNVFNHPSWATSRKEGKVWYSSSLSGCTLQPSLCSPTRFNTNHPW